MLCQKNKTINSPQLITLSNPTALPTNIHFYRILVEISIMLKIKEIIVSVQIKKNSPIKIMMIIHNQMKTQMKA